MYGSSLMCVTFSPLASISAPTDAAPRPLPIKETTPPVTKTNLVRLLMTVAPRMRGAPRQNRADRQSAYRPRAASTTPTETEELLYENRRHSRLPQRIVNVL